MLVTGFGPFGNIGDNPSAMLAEGCGLPHRVLEVSFEAVDSFVDEVDPASFDKLLLIGVAAGAERFRIETVARNAIGATPDVRGVVWGPGPIDPLMPRQLAATLWRASELFLETDEWGPSVDAGTYLCNYAFFRAVERFPEKAVGFLHVPALKRVDFGVQRERLARVLGLLGV